ncbi:MAG: NTP transferase domain-containing protein [Nitrospirae bacterium]|nr:NTP transferase domain-containing protein [Nitrospirota bacterium]MBI3593355.1 NTP transferase domain-containing protein [Nitrospirota bacterium]
MPTPYHLKSDLSVNILLPHFEVDLHGIVLAAGHGTRMVEYIKNQYGTSHPKQFVAFTGKRTMIQHTLDRVERLIARDKLLVVVDPKHQPAFQEQLKDRPSGTLIFQPINRETAPGILLPLSYIYKKNPECTVAVFPSDHFILEEDHFMEHIEYASRAIQSFPDKVLLLGVQPDAPETEYGWIQTGERVSSIKGFEINRVEKFHEKPDRKSAETFLSQGYLWNTLVLITRCSTLLKLVKDALPDLHRRFGKIIQAIGKPEESEVILQEYQEMEQATISQQVLEKFPSRLLVIHVRGVLWNDWGSGMRVLETLQKIGIAPACLKPSSLT